jgi:signal transduction histidine kinase
MSAARKGMLARLHRRDALEYERLNAELRTRIEDVRASRARLLASEEEARRRLERSLHDGAQQRLIALSLELRMARAKLKDDPDKADAMIVAELARGIHPAVLTDRGLKPALESLAGKSPVPVEIASLPEDRLPPRVESAAYGVVAEALSNAARYSHASHCVVSVARDNGLAMVEVRDDGVGGVEMERGYGLRSLADRLSVLDGSLEIVSGPGEGTIVYAEIPCG